jgi:hypothetical protein
MLVIFCVLNLFGRGEPPCPNYFGLLYGLLLSGSLYMDPSFIHSYNKIKNTILQGSAKISTKWLVKQAFHDASEEHWDIWGPIWLRALPCLKSTFYQISPGSLLSYMVSYDAFNRNKVSICQLSFYFPTHYMFRPLQAIFRWEYTIDALWGLFLLPRIR